MTLRHVSPPMSDSSKNSETLHYVSEVPSIGLIVGMHCMQVAADALVATEIDLRSKLKAANDEIEEKRRLLADLNTRYDAVAAELAGAEANLSSADDLVTSAKAHLALKESLLFEKETLIAALKKRMRTGAKSSAAAPRFWQSFNRFRRSPGPAADQEVPASNA